MPIHRRPGSSPSSVDLRGDVGRARGGRAPAPRRRRRGRAPRPRTRRPSRARSPSGGRSTTSSGSRARRSGAPSSRGDLGIESGGDAEAAAGLLTHRPLEQRDAFDVRRVREHVHRPHLNQREAAVDHLARVGRERRRVAGDVDDPLRAAVSSSAAHHLLRKPGARRVDDDDVGPRRLFGERPDRVCGRRRRRSGHCRSRSAARSRSRRRSPAPTMSTPQTSPRAAPAARLSVPMPQKRSKTRSWPVEARVLGGELVEALGHLGVGLEEGLGRDARSAGPRALPRAARRRRARVVSPPCETSATRRRPRPQHGGVAGSARAPPPRAPSAAKSPWLRDEPNLQVAGAAALADDEVAQEAVARRGGRSARRPCSAHQSRTKLRTALLRSDASTQSRASSTRSQLPARVEAERELAVVVLRRRSTPSCSGSARCSARRRSARARSPSVRRAAASASVDLRLLVLELALVAQSPATASRDTPSPSWSQRSGTRSGLGSSSSTARAFA